MSTAYITLSSSMDWRTRTGKAYVVIEQPGKALQQYTKSLPAMTDNKIMLIAAAGALEWIPDGTPCVIRTASPLGVERGKAAHPLERQQLVALLRKKRCKCKYEVMSAESIREAARTPRMVRQTTQPPARLPDSPTITEAKWNGPENFADYEVSCDCGKSLKFSFWMFFRCDQSKTLQCSCGEKTVRYYNAETGKFGM